jgi:hypothetical protein
LPATLCGAVPGASVTAGGTLLDVAELEGYFVPADSESGSFVGRLLRKDRTVETVANDDGTLSFCGHRLVQIAPGVFADADGDQSLAILQLLLDENGDVAQVITAEGQTYLAVGFFEYSPIATVLFWALILIAAFFADQMESLSPAQLQFLEYLRHIAFVLGILDVVLLSLPREVDYPVIHTPKFRDIITVPLSNKKYMLGMVVVFAWQFSLYCHNTFLQVYLMDTIGITYFLYCFIIFVYPFFFPFSMKFWQNRIQKTSWLRALAFALMIEAPLQLLYAFIRPGAPWMLAAMLLIIRLPQHFAGVGRNSIVANMQYLNMPHVNRTCYTSFYQIVFNLGAAAGLLFGTVFVAVSKNLSVPLFGYSYEGGIPWLIALSGIIQLGIVAYVLLMGKKLEPDPE